MKIKIEDKPMKAPVSSSAPEFGAFLKAVKSLSVGQSFTVLELPGAYRNALSVANVLMDAHFITRRTDEGVRVGRVA